MSPVSSEAAVGGVERPASSFADPDTVARYRDGPPRQVPGFAGLHRMTDLLVAERTPDDGRELVLGAGGGLELEHLAAAHAAVASARAGPFDAVVCLLTMPFIPAGERLDTLRHLCRGLKPGSMFTRSPPVQKSG